MGSIITGKATISYADVPNVLTDPKPVVFWDTCSMLYYLSMIDRRAYIEYQWDEKLLDLIETGKVYSVTSFIVLKEYNDHHDKLLNADKGKEEVMKSMMKEYAKCVGSPLKEDIEKGADSLALAERMEDMANRLWANTFIVDKDVSFMEKAHNRVLAGSAPASVKQEYKDCYIWETFLTVADMLPNKEFAYFMTENTDDYCGKGCKTPFTDIVNECQGHQCNIMLSKNRLWVDIAKRLGIIS